MRVAFTTLFVRALLVVASATPLAACGGVPEGNIPDGDCTTGTYWTGGDEGSSRMHPGGDCIACHAREDEGPSYALAGTVMGGATDVTDCDGIPDVEVDIVDKDGNVALTLTTNDAGNFFSQAGIPSALLPYTVVLRAGEQTREMFTPQTEQNCMACHTAEGASGAPGRILAPE